MLLKALFIASATILPLPLGLGRVALRGHRTEELSPSLPKPVEDLGPFPVKAEDSPCHALPLATSSPARRVLSNASEPLQFKDKNASDASRDGSDVDTYWDRVDGLKVASARAFARWMHAQNLYADMSLRHLMSLYAEYCWTFDLKPLSERSLLNRLKKAGFETCRPPATVVDGKLRRPTVYRLRRQARRAA